ncbi:methyltransferase domain-containing protein [Dechloromonas sp. HYN0024]|uniref:methyltransferase domain-containing protein n=1 Tax=Dechloromonas sp. HYN0024 TaxID=2231055 RepID=UPI000E442F92|nr:methyltransferase domain-containing protein [Dechloromonas sp. HYN0024]AXS80354.1 methyltransferase domain-containing protein [Dechloromonas sp. HYN0024]
MKYQAKIDVTNKNNSHTLALDRVNDYAQGRPLKVLEVGCSSGYFGAALVDRGHEVWGVEPCAEAAEKARDALHKVHVGFVEDFFSLNRGVKFDAIVFGDVLEHLLNPVEVLSKSADFLVDDGIVVASLPNVAHIAIRAMLLEGRWDYGDLGILDRTHLRFFTRESSADLFETAGFEVYSLDSVRLSAEQVVDLCNLSISAESIHAAKKYARDDRGYDFQYVISAKPILDVDKDIRKNIKYKYNDGLRVLCLVHDPFSSIVEIRLRAPLNHWASRYGGNVKIVSLFESQNCDFHWADIVVFQRDASEYTVSLAKFLQNLGKKVVFEIDDLLTELPDFLNHHLEAINNSRPYLEKLISSSDALSVSNDELAEYFGNKNEKIFINKNYSVPVVNPARQFSVPPSRISLIVASSDKVLVDMLINPLLFLQKEFGVRVVAIGPPGLRLAQAGVEVIQHENMGHSAFKDFISSIYNSIGLIPLDSSLFSSCKTAVKYFDYSVCGIPCVCSNVKPYSLVVDNKVSGILVENDSESWISAISSLMFSHDLRSDLVKSAQRNVALNHNIDASADSWFNLLSSLGVDIDSRGKKEFAEFNPRSNFLSVSKFILRHCFRVGSYIKAGSTLRKHGFRGLLENIVRR